MISHLVSVVIIENFDVIINGDPADDKCVLFGVQVVSGLTAKGCLRG